MKKLLIVMLLSLNLFGYSNTTVKCIEGYKYVIVESDKGVAIIQMFAKDSGNYIYTHNPVKCKVHKKGK